MTVGIHCKRIGHSHSALLGSRMRRNDKGGSFPENALSFVVAGWRYEKGREIVVFHSIFTGHFRREIVYYPGF